jgi:hypothetical protein
MAVTEIQGGPPLAAEPVATPVAGSAGAKFKAAAPIAAGALAIVAAIAGASVLGGNGADTAAPAGQVIASNDAPATSAAPTISETATLPIDPAMNPPPMSAAPAPAPKPGSSIPGVQFDQAPAAGAAQGIEIVVKLKDDAKVKDIVDAFWKDQASAKSKFDAWKARRPEFAGLKLDRVTYSNELVLVHDGSVAAGQRIAAMRDIAAKLGKTADISYAEPNLTAHPGGQ